MGKASRNKHARSPSQQADQIAAPPVASPSNGHDDTYISLRDAINTGVVIEADEELQAQAGFRLEVVYSTACHQRHIEWTSADTSQDEIGRAGDVLNLAALALHRSLNAHGQALTGIYSVPPGQQTVVFDNLRVAWLGDEWDEPVVLIMLATESVRGINAASQLPRINEQTLQLDADDSEGQGDEQ